MIHLGGIANQQYQNVPPQPPQQFPQTNPYPNYDPSNIQQNNHNNNRRNNNSNNNNNHRNNGKRDKREEDWDICWDYLSPKGCNRDKCRWRHGNPKIDQRQIAKRRKRYIEENERNRKIKRQQTLIGGPDNNKSGNCYRCGQHGHYQRECPQNNNNSAPNNIWNNPPSVTPIHMMHGPPPPPPYFAPPPPPHPHQGQHQPLPSGPQMPPPQSPQQPQQQQHPPSQGQIHDYWAQYYSAYGYMQQPPMPHPQQATRLVFTF